MELGDQQARGVHLGRAWLRAALAGATSQQIFRVFGFAGTGKSTIIKHIVDGMDDDVLYCAPTGKAALVMRRKGCHGAMTTHRALYQVSQRGTSALEELLEKLREAQASDDQTLVEILQAEIAAEEARLRELTFYPRPDSPASEAAFLVLDEGSMVGTKIGQDLVNLGIPILVQCDPFQLQPVKDVAYFTNGTPDVFLTDVHRQALDSGILRLATDLRNGVPYRLGEYGPDCRVVRHLAPGNMDLVLAADQMIVGRNKTRRDACYTLRKARGRVGQFPLVGDRLVCLRNDYRLGVVNGSQWMVLDPGRREGPFHKDVGLESTDGEGKRVATIHAPIFDGQEVSGVDAGKAAYFDFADAVTCHKAQGSEWPRVCVLDESQTFGPEWVYTACTRPSEDLTLVTKSL